MSGALVRPAPPSTGNADVTRRALLAGNFGAPGCGKSHRQKLMLTRLAPDRLVIVDPDGEYEGWGPLYLDPAELYRATLARSFRVRFKPDFERPKAEQQFDAICQMVRWHTDPQPRQAPPPCVAPVVLCVDELADYVGSSFRESPRSWQWVVRRGRKYAVSLLAASQRPEEIDKTFFNLASFLCTGRLNGKCDALADSLGVKSADIQALVDYEFIGLDKGSGTRVGIDLAQLRTRAGRQLDQAPTVAPAAAAALLDQANGRPRSRPTPQLIDRPIDR